MTDCNGFQYFKDQLDNTEYIYTNLECSHCHKCFPTFDQPDLKAPYELLTLVPKDWIVTSTMPESAVFTSSDAKYAEALSHFGLDGEGSVVKSIKEDFHCF